MRLFAAICFAFASLSAYAADDKKAPAKPSGSWTHKAEEFELRFNFGKDDLKITAKTGEASMNLTCKCEIDKEGVITVTINEVKTKGEFPAVPKEGQEMSFKFTVDGKKAKLSDFKSKDLGDHAKAVIEGDYESKSD